MGEYVPDDYMGIGFSILTEFSDSLAEATLEATDNGILVIDKDRNVSKYNSRFAELWRIPAEILASKDDEKLLGFVLDQLADAQQFLDKVIELYAQPEAESFDTINFKDGRIFERFSRPMHLNGEAVARVWSFRDITLTEQVKRKFRREVGFRNTIIHTLPDLIWLKDPDGVYLACNTRFEEFFGATESKIMGKTDHDFVDADLADFFREHDKKAMQKASPSVNEEWITFANDGHKELLETTKTPMYDDDGAIIGVLGIGHNITERKKAEAFDEKNAEILEMIATGEPASKIYDEIALMYEARHPGMRCSMLELHDGKLLHGGAPSLPKEYCDAVHGLQNGPEVGSCGTSTYTGHRVLVENIDTDPKWAEIKHVAMPYGMRCCWSEPIKNSRGKVLGAFGMYYNHPALPNEEESADLKSAARLAGIVMERDQAQKRIRQLAYEDELTGLASRACFYQVLEEFIKQSTRNKQRFGLLYIDLDDFKGINDSLGHDVGDMLLKTIGERLSQVCREIDFIARLSGDEFCILVKEVGDDYAAASVAQRCLDVISKPIELAARKFIPSCSIGIAHYPDDGEDSSGLLKAGDTSLYAAKERGKNQYAFYQAELTRKAEYRFQVEQYLREAINNQQLSLVYQPQIDIATGRIIGVEALSRWQHPILGEVEPGVFIGIAERIGMIKPLTEWVLRRACAQAVAWRDQGFPPVRMAVNISPSHFLDKDIVVLVQRIIKETGMLPDELELEVTESVVQTDLNNLKIFSDLKNIGVQLAIDDFGIGYSSFSSLKHLTVDCLKIDKHFINDMLADDETQLLVGAMINMGHILGCGIVAEGVEQAEQFTKLKEQGCETVQGNLFSRPVCATELQPLFHYGLGIDKDFCGLFDNSCH